VLGLTSLAGAEVCHDQYCALNGCNGLDENKTCDTCVTDGGTISIAITSGLECDGESSDCADLNCSNPDTLRAESTIYYGNSAGSPGDRDVLVCEMLFDCDAQVVCKLCTELTMTPAPTPDVEVLDEFVCEDLSPGEYQYMVTAVDVEGQDCPCNEDPCESACAATCDSSNYAWAISCCLNW
ncbi:hypothetical protein ACFLU6_13670, partial [Acidobacteriota bacterium]